MTIRVTQGMTAADVLASIESISARLADTQNVLATGRRINSPSDDPYGTGQALVLSGDLSATQQYEKNVNEAQSWLNVSDSALSNVSDLVQQARTLVVQAANGTLSQSDLDNIKTQLQQIVDAIKSEGNAQYAGSYVFAGTNTAVAPYQVGSGSSDVYGGDGNSVYREIGPGIKVAINALGSDAIGSYDAGPPPTGSGLLKVLNDVIADVGSGNTTALQSTDLQNIDTANDQLLNVRATVGATSNRLQTASSRLSQIEQVTTSQLSDTRDADMAKTMIDLSQEQAVYQAALRAGANLLQPSLMDFLATG